MRDTNSSNTRRNVLKLGAAAVGASGLIVGSATASYRDAQRFNAHVEQALEIELREDTNAMVDFMRDKGYAAASKNSTLGFNEGGEPSIEKVGDVEGSGIDGSMAGFYNTSLGHYSMSFGVDYFFSVLYDASCYMGVSNSYGTDPNDGAMLHWNTDQDVYWDPVDDSSVSSFVYTSGEAEFDDGTYKPSGAIGFELDDATVHRNWIDDVVDNCNGGGTFEEYVTIGRCGVQLIPAGSHDPSDREVRARLTHAWESSTSNTSVSVSYPGSIGVSISPSSEVEQQETQTESDGDTFLSISQDEVFSCC
ncbi:hypothetical protein [Halovivax gelatinilyticus]|uniref:hypothetical protein n=1 Tax=Halovivax gelatinilyticus TaxID=2961597 RepID=UPI0020CA3E98|nr:hypothetical protein [Halovivax gelatinilyticus]